MKVLFDTCILIDALRSRKPWSGSAQDLLIAVADQRVEGFITAKECTDIFYLMRKYLSSKEEAIQQLKKITILFQILDTTGEDIKKSLQANMIDFEDTVMVRTAERGKMDYICTRNLKDFSQHSFPVIEPDDLIKKL